MMRVLIPVLILALTAFQTDKPTYLLYTQTGKATTYARLVQAAVRADVVLFGELHNNPICHWLELQLTRDLAQQRGQQLVLGAEMFEADSQASLTGYVGGRLSAGEFGQRARLWPNYTTDYQPVVDLARARNLPFIATNVPRRYASLVARQGLAVLDTVSETGKRQMAALPLPVDLTLPGYRQMLTMMSSHGGTSAPDEHGQAENFARAQALKDATMARFILDNWQPGHTFLHLNGDYHSKNFEGIVWYLRRQKPDLNIVTISSVEAETITSAKPDWKNLATYVLAIPADMTKTY